MKRRKKNLVERAFHHGFKAGVRGHEMEACPFYGTDKRGAWCAGWREGRSNFIYGYVVFPEHS